MQPLPEGRTIRNKTINMQSIALSPEDFSQDRKNNIVSATDPTGETVAVDTWKYALYFFEKIQRKDISDRSIYIDGIRLDRFIDLFVKGKHHQRIADFIVDKTSCSLYWEMVEKHGVHINWVALYGLCSYIQEIINRRLAVLLKPTLKETVDELGGVDNLDCIMFKLKDGSSHVTDFPEVKHIVWTSLKNGVETSYGFHKIVRKVDIYTHEYGEIEFVRYISRFMHDYFSSVKRRKNSYLTITEQKIVCFLLKFFGFAPEKVQESRFRQLFNSKYNAIDHIMPLSIPGVLETNLKVYLEYLPYSIWNKGRINPLKEKELHEDSSLTEFTIKMGENPDLTELQNLISGII